MAVGGFFCSYEKTHCIFIFERASGRIVKRVSEFPRHVRRLAWSADGKVVAAGMGGKAGIRLLRTADWSELGRELITTHTSARFRSAAVVSLRLQAGTARYAFTATTPTGSR